MRQALWKEPGDQYHSGVFGLGSRFDGIACKDSNGWEATTTGGPDSFIRTEIPSSANELTIEFWFRLESKPQRSFKIA